MMIYNNHSGVAKTYFVVYLSAFHISIFESMGKILLNEIARKKPKEKQGHQSFFTSSIFGGIFC